MMTNEYLARYTTKNYYISRDTENTKYQLVNKHTLMVELESPMLPQVLVNMYNFEDALDELSDISSNPQNLAKVIQFKTDDDNT